MDLLKIASRVAAGPAGVPGGMTEPFRIGPFVIDSVQRVRYDMEDADGPDGYPQFRVKGSIEGFDFERMVSLELDGRDAEEEHISGEDLGDWDYDSSDLYEAVYQSPAYKQAVKEYHSPGGSEEPEDPGPPSEPGPPWDTLEEKRGEK